MIRYNHVYNTSIFALVLLSLTACELKQGQGSTSTNANAGTTTGSSSEELLSAGDLAVESLNVREEAVATELANTLNGLIPKNVSGDQASASPNPGQGALPIGPVGPQPCDAVVVPNAPIFRIVNPSNLSTAKGDKTRWHLYHFTQYYEYKRGNEYARDRITSISTAPTFWYLPKSDLPHLDIFHRQNGMLDLSMKYVYSNNHFQRVVYDQKKNVFRREGPVLEPVAMAVMCAAIAPSNCPDIFRHEKILQHMYRDMKNLDMRFVFFTDHRGMRRLSIHVIQDYAVTPLKGDRLHRVYQLGARAQVNPLCGSASTPNNPGYVAE